MQAGEPSEKSVSAPADGNEPSRVRTVVTLSLLAAAIVVLVIVPRVLSPVISSGEESPERHFQAMCVLCHSFE